MLKRIIGFDYLRAFFSILVVVWHTKGVSFVVERDRSLQWVVDVFYYNICLLAVPVFFSISLYLFYKKQLIEQNSSPAKRLSKLLTLYCIWMFIGIATNLIFGQSAYLLKLTNLKSFLLILIKGSRPELFFLFSLMIVSCLAIINGKYLLSKKYSFWIQLTLLFCSLLILWLVSFATLITHRTILSAYWNPICFIPYIFSSSILVLIDQHREASPVLPFRKKVSSLPLVLVFVFLLLSWLEWQFFKAPLVFGYLLPPYARASLVIGAFLACFCAIFYREKGRSPIWVHALAQESLGIYLLHGYALLLIGFLMVKLQSLQLLYEMISNPLVRVMLAVAISAFLSKVFKQSKIGRAMLNSSSR